MKCAFVRAELAEDYLHFPAFSGSAVGFCTRTNAG